MHSNASLGRLEWIEFGIFVLLLVVVIILLSQCRRRRVLSKPAIRQVSTMRRWRDFPEIWLLMLALPLQLLWEIAQFPLYTVWHEGDWGYIIYGLIHCTLGDLLIMLGIFWLISIFNRSRSWIFSPSLINIISFTASGLVYTIFSEIINTRVKGTWGYTELMPIVPVIEIGGMPFLQWLLIPPVLIWLMHVVRPAQTYEQ